MANSGKRVLKINPHDNVAVALTDLRRGEQISVEGEQLVLTSDVACKHKLSTVEIADGEYIRMYGIIVGRATHAIPRGGLLTRGTIEHCTAEHIDPMIRNTDWEGPDVGSRREQTFCGYHRSDGSVGTQNVWLVLPLVFCENRTIAHLQHMLTTKLGYDLTPGYEIDLDTFTVDYQKGKNDTTVKTSETGDSRVFPNVDRISFLTHTLGCGGTQKDARLLCRLLAGYVANPNVAGATFVSLGCQNAHIDMMKQALRTVAPESDKPVYFIERQQTLSHQDFISKVVENTLTGLQYADRFQRTPAPLNKLVLGLECGGSDGFSGISANPALGFASDILAALGGTPVLAEFPELYGVEQELASRCLDSKEARKFLHLMQIYAEKARAESSNVTENLSHGNLKDGLITSAMKSAGAALKGGTSPIVKVLDYTEQVCRGGLNLLCTPGNDVESTTGLAGSGASVIGFTTGLGTPTGNPVAPVIKISSNTPLYHRMDDIIDFNAGTVISGEKTIAACGSELFDYIVAVAGGKVVVKADRWGYDDFTPWKRGLSL